jgi:hypothetical protein
VMSGPTYFFLARGDWNQKATPDFYGME